MAILDFGVQQSVRDVNKKLNGIRWVDISGMYIKSKSMFNGYRSTRSSQNDL